jgi:hypothetical protein
MGSGALARIFSDHPLQGFTWTPRGYPAGRRRGGLDAGSGWACGGSAARRRVNHNSAALASHPATNTVSPAWLIQ